MKKLKLLRTMCVACGFMLTTGCTGPIQTLEAAEDSEKYTAETSEAEITDASETTQGDDTDYDTTAILAQITDYLTGYVQAQEITGLAAIDTDGMGTGNLFCTICVYYDEISPSSIQLVVRDVTDETILFKETFRYGSGTKELAYADLNVKQPQLLLTEELTIQAVQTGEAADGLSGEKSAVCELAKELGEELLEAEAGAEKATLSVLDFGAGSINQAVPFYIMYETETSVKLYPVRYFREYEWMDKPEKALDFLYTVTDWEDGPARNDAIELAQTEEDGLCILYMRDGYSFQYQDIYSASIYAAHSGTGSSPSVSYDRWSYEIYMAHLQQYVIARYALE